MNLTAPRLLIAALCLACAPNSKALSPEEMDSLKKKHETLSTLLSNDPSSIKALSQRGDIQLFMHQFEGAIADFEKMISVDPSQDAPHWRLGIAYYFAGAFEKSSQQFAKYHAFDGRDRENGIWKFMADAQLSGLEAAAKQMLPYSAFDRHPFPLLYDLFAGNVDSTAVLAAIAKPAFEQQPQVRFFGHYYTGIYLVLKGKKPDGIQEIEKAVALFSNQTAQHGGPGYMWQVARIHLAVLKKELPRSP